MPSSLGDACPLDQLEGRKIIIFDTPSEDDDRTEGGQLSTDYHRG
jgi:hypothetical protein